MIFVFSTQSARRLRAYGIVCAAVLAGLCGAVAGCGHDEASASAPAAAQGSPDGHAPAADAQTSRSSASVDTTTQVANVPADAQSAPTGDPQLTPISSDDINLYLDVMRAAADRVRHPTPQDFDALRKQKAFMDASTAAAKTDAAAEQALNSDTARIQAEILAAAQSGDTAKVKALGAEVSTRLKSDAAALQSPTLPDDATMTQAMNLLHGQADLQIVAERHIDADHYQRVVSVIEEIYVPPGTAVGDCGGDCGVTFTAEQLRAQKAHEAGVTRNRKILAPYATEIRSLQAEVRNSKE